MCAFDLHAIQYARLPHTLHTRAGRLDWHRHLRHLSAARVHHAFHLEKQVCIILIFQIGNFFCAIHVVADEYWVLAWPQLRPYLQLRVLLCEAREARLCKELTNAPATTAVRTIPERECFELPNATRTHAIPGSSVLLRRALSTTTLRHLRH